MIVGIDEAGRGCWAGPLVAAAVILTKPLPGLADSKKLSRRRREELDGHIRAQAVYGLGWVWPAEIDRLGLTAATTKAMAEALAQISDTYDEVIIDGHIDYLPSLPQARPLIKADATVPAVSAASILAKVARDRYMCEVAAKFPDYQFERHVGYGTAVHIERLKLHGPCELHRLSYRPVKAFLVVNT